MQSKRIRGWLAALGTAALIVAAATAVLAGLLEAHARRMVPVRAEERLGETLATERDRLDNRLAPLHAQIYLVLDWIRAGSVAPGDTDALVTLCLPVLARSPALGAMRVAHGAGSEWMLSREAHGWLSRRVDEVDGAGRSTWIRWDRDGVPLDREERGDTTYDPRRTPWYRGAMAQRLAWQTRPDLADPELYFGAPDWSAPPDELRLVLSLAMQGDGADTVICFEVEPAAMLRSRLVCLAPGGHLVSTPDGMSQEVAVEIAAALHEAPSAQGTLLVETANGKRWVRAAPYAFSPDTTVTLIASAPEPQLRTLESGLQRAALLASPLAVLVLALLLRLLEAWPTTRRATSPQGVLDAQEAALLAVRPPQAYLQALDSARKQTRRLRAELDAQLRGRHTQDAHWRDAVARIESGREALFSLLTADEPWRGTADDALGRFLACATHTLVLDWCSMWRLEPGGTALRCLACTGVSPQSDVILPTRITRAEHPMFFLAIEVESAVDSREAAADPRLMGLVGKHGVHPVSQGRAAGSKRALLAVPIRLGQQLIGVLCFERSGHWRAWEADETAFAQGLAQLLAMRFHLPADDGAV